MTFTEDKMEEKPLIIIEENPEVVTGQGEGETPVITIESINMPKRGRTAVWVLSMVAALLAVCLTCVAGYWYYRRYVNIGIPTSIKSEQNIAKLQRKAGAVTPEVIMTSDSILGVALNFYEIRGLKAEISFEEPDVTDADVYLYSRCADQTSYDAETNQYLGSLVVEGEELQSDVCRLGYCAMANGNVVIGIARDEKVKDYVQEQGGSFFRQFILVSNHTLPSRFFLHGKVERRGLGRKGDSLFYIETRHKETMWDFADALREYGFVDAIYITGGDDWSFYRTADGTAHGIGGVRKHEDKRKGAGLVPWLVFRKR